MQDDSERQNLGQIKVPSWAVVLFLLFALALLAANAYAPDKGDYTKQSPDGIKRMLVTLFAFSVFLERAVEVFIVLVARPRALGEIEELERGRSDADAMSPPAETKGPEVEKASRSRALIAEQTLRRHRHLTSEISIGLAFLAGLLLTFCGLHPLAEFMAPPKPGAGLASQVQFHLFYVLDALLTAALLAGGSKGVHTAANAILSFVNRFSETPRRWRRTR